MDDNSRHCLEAFFVDFHTSKKVVLRSPFLRLPQVLLQLAIILYVVIYSIGYQLQFMEQRDVDADVDIGVSNPVSNWGNCTNADFDCYLDLGNISELPYCFNQTPFGYVYMQHKRHNRFVKRCWHSDLHVKPASKILIPTMFSFLYQKWDWDIGDWMTDKVNEYYMMNIESFVLRFRHSFVTSNGVRQEDIMKSSIDMEGILSSDNRRYKFAHGPALSQLQSSGSRPWSSIQELETCGTDPSATNIPRTTCSSTVQGDEVSVAKMLQFAGIPSLDEARPKMKGVTYRQSGLILSAHINYRNDDSVWVRFFHTFRISDILSPPPFYTVSFNLEPLAQDFVVESEVTHPTKNNKDAQEAGEPDLNVRVVQQRTGILVRVTAAGTLLSASTRQLLISLVTGLGLMVIANILVEKILVKLYRRFDRTKHVNAMFKVHKLTGGAHEDDMYKHLELIEAEHPETYKDLVETDFVTGQMIDRRLSKRFAFDDHHRLATKE